MNIDKCRANLTRIITINYEVFAFAYNVEEEGDGAGWKNIRTVVETSKSPNIQT